MNRSHAIERMNYLGKNKKPFLFIIDFDMLHSEVVPLNDINNRKILFQIPGQRNYENDLIIQKELVFKKYPISFDKYKNAFLEVMKNIHAGNTYLLNLTFPTRIETNLTLLEIFYCSKAKYKLLLVNRFVVFSPETFVKISGGKIFSFPMKGTIDASIESAHEKILADEKELAEHITIVDLIRNDLSIVAKNVRVDNFRYIEEIKTHEKTLLQVSTKITGDLPTNFYSHIGEIIFTLLPAGSVSGAPKKKTIEIIKKAEGYNRGYYTGIFGMFDGESLDSAVMIRFIEKQKEEFIFKSGGGITALSDPQSEYQELIEKVYVPVI